MTTPDAPEWTHTAFLVRAWDELMASRASARRNPPPRGVDGMGPDAFETRKLHHCAEVSRILQRPGDSAPTAYRFAPLVEHERETEPGKVRRVYIPRIRDQVVLRCVYQNLARAMRADGLRGSLENPQAVVRTVIRARQRGRRFAARLDVRGFYDSVSHDVLADRLAELSLDEVSASLLHQLVRETPHRPFRGTKNDNAWRAIGLPTGISVATLLAELYLKPVDAVAANLPDIDATAVDDVVCWATTKARRRPTLAVPSLQLELHGNKTHFSSFARALTGVSTEGYQLQVALDRILVEEALRDPAINLRSHAEAAPAVQLQAVVDAFHREISSSAACTSATTPWPMTYPLPGRGPLSERMLGLARRAGVSLQLESHPGPGDTKRPRQPPFGPRPGSRPESPTVIG